jgi:carboxymethylenebutenolidase
MPRLEVRTPAPDGQCRGTLHVPDGEGARPGALVFPDAGGVRETFGLMGDRLTGLVSPLTNDAIIADARAYADSLLARPEVSGSAIGTTGYYLDPSSPHLSADRITAAVYVAGCTAATWGLPTTGAWPRGAGVAGGVI